MDGVAYPYWWISDDVLSYMAFGGTGFVRLGASGSSPAQILTGVGDSPYQTKPSTKQAFFIQQRGDCATAPDWLVDFNGPTVTTSAGATYSPDFSWTAVTNAQDLSKFDLHPANALTSAPLITLDYGQTSCARGPISWANTAAELAWTDSAGNLKLTTLSATSGTTTADPGGSYGGSPQSLGFSPDDRLLGFLAGGAPSYVYVEVLGSGQPAARVNVDPNSSQGYSAYGYSFAPNSKSVAYELLSPNNATALYWVDLSSGSPSAPRAISTTAIDPDKYPAAAIWSVDSTHLAYQASKPVESNTILFVVDLTNANDMGTSVTAPLLCPSGVNCPTIQSFAFQP
jgi:hypothetical protein